MIIKQTNINIIYPRIMDYRKKFVNAEHILQDYFQEPTILPIPDEVQGDIPRIVIQTRGEHSSLNIGLDVAALISNYDDEFEEEWIQCKDYIEEKGEIFYNLIGEMTGNDFKFSGIIVNITYEDRNDGMELIKENLLKLDKIETPFDAGCKFTYLYDNKYYVNISIENSRQFMVEEIKSKMIIRDEVGNHLDITIDINDKYAYNTDEDYLSNKGEFQNILTIMDNIISNKLDDLLMKGEFCL